METRLCKYVRYALANKIQYLFMSDQQSGVYFHRNIHRPLDYRIP